MRYIVGKQVMLKKIPAKGIDSYKTGTSSLCIKPRGLCGKQNGRNYHADYHHYTNSYYFFHKTSIAQ